MTSCKKRILTVLLAVMSIMLCLWITHMPSVQPSYTVYADEEYKPDGLTVGDSGDMVKWIQESLNIINNAGLEESGYFDENTEEAVKVIQGQHNMTQSGVATRATIELIRQFRKRAEKTMTTVTETETTQTVTEAVTTEHVPKITRPTYPDPRNVHEKKDGHLFSGYWSEFFATLKSLIAHPKATLAPVKSAGTILLVLCGALALFALFFSLPIVPVMINGEYDALPIIGEGCFGAMLKLIGVIYLLSPIADDVNYITHFSDTKIGWAILLAIIFTALRLALGLIVGGLILLAIFALLQNISEDAAMVIGLIPGIAVLLLFYFIPVIMQMWYVYGDKAA